MLSLRSRATRLLTQFRRLGSLADVASETKLSSFGARILRHGETPGKSRLGKHSAWNDAEPDLSLDEVEDRMHGVDLDDHVEIGSGALARGFDRGAHRVRHRRQDQRKLRQRAELDPCGHLPALAPRRADQHELFLADAFEAQLVIAGDVEQQRDLDAAELQSLDQN